MKPPLSYRHFPASHVDTAMRAISSPAPYGSWGFSAARNNAWSAAWQARSRWQVELSVYQLGSSKTLCLNSWEDAVPHCSYASHRWKIAKFCAETCRNWPVISSSVSLIMLSWTLNCLNVPQLSTIYLEHWWPPQTAMWVLALFFFYMAKEGSAQVCGGCMLLAPWMPWIRGVSQRKMHGSWVMNPGMLANSLNQTLAKDGASFLFRLQRWSNTNRSRVLPFSND